jgi:hypothetical protein
LKYLVFVSSGNITTSVVYLLSIRAFFAQFHANASGVLGVVPVLRQACSGLLSGAMVARRGGFVLLQCDP